LEEYSCRAHFAVGRRWASALGEDEGDGESEGEGSGEGEDENEGEDGDAEAAAAAAVEDDDDDPRGPVGERRKAVSAAADTGSTVGDDEAAGRWLEREWDGAAIHRGVNPLLTMTGQSTNAAAWCRAALGPWLGVFIHACT
jgi:hypothetical protein